MWIEKNNPEKCYKSWNPNAVNVKNLLNNDIMDCSCL